jgi:hypothetical protein
MKFMYIFFSFYNHKIMELPASQSRELPEKSTVPQLVTELHTFYRT